MDRFCAANSGSNADSKIFDPKRRKISENLLEEKRKLENMISMLFEKGEYNLGTDKRILRQSGKLDKLIVDEMLLDEIEEKYLGDKQKK